MAPDAAERGAVRSEHEDLHDGALSGGEREIGRQHFVPAELSFDDQPKGPKEEHIADEVKEIGVQECGGDPLDGMQSVAEGQEVGLDLAGVGHFAQKIKAFTTIRATVVKGQ